MLPLFPPAVPVTKEQAKSIENHYYFPTGQVTIEEVRLFWVIVGKAPHFEQVPQHLWQLKSLALQTVHVSFVNSLHAYSICFICQTFLFPVLVPL